MTRRLNSVARCGGNFVVDLSPDFFDVGNPLFLVTLIQWSVVNIDNSHLFLRYLQYLEGRAAAEMDSPVWREVLAFYLVFL